MTAYQIALFAHSYLRWVVVILGIFLCVRAYMAWRSERLWEPGDERLHVAVVASFDIQFTLGLLLYVFLSPLPRMFFADMSTNMKDPTLRFFGLDHAVAMLVATAIVHIGRVRSKHATTDRVRHGRVWVTTLFALLLIGAATPWPGLQYGRPLLRGVTADVGVTHDGVRSALKPLP
ncbi:MAG: hypothetical protein AB7G75_15660 [Candidatus Binatia bacterium]